MRLTTMVVLSGLVALCGAGGGGQALAQTVYQGETVVAVQVLDPLSGRAISQDRFRHAVQVVVDRRLAGGGQRESNPFNLAINPVGVPTQEGQFSIFSAIPFYDPRNVRDQRDLLDPRRIDFLIQYWQFQKDGARISGSLVDSHRQEALAVNLLNAVDLNLLPVGLRFATPLAMVEGTTLQGTIDGTQVDLRLSGNTVDSFHPFEARIVATRIQ
jgi:hypothetical protein